MTIMDEMNLPLKEQAYAVLINTDTFGAAYHNKSDDANTIRVTVGDCSEKKHKEYLDVMEEAEFKLLETILCVKDAEGKYDAMYLFQKKKAS